MRHELDLKGKELLFTKARTHHAWLAKSVNAEILRELYELMKFAPTSLNSQPTHLVFLVSMAAKARLLPHLTGSNPEQVKAAPVTAIVAYDMQFYNHLEQVFPKGAKLKNNFSSNAELTERHGLRNSSLQGAYLMLAARALGLDVCGMSGFRNQAVDAEFFPSGRFRSNFLCNIGYGDDTQLSERAPRLSFAEACQIL